jgi:hypothetical protein
MAAPEARYTYDKGRCGSHASEDHRPACQLPVLCCFVASQCAISFGLSPVCRPLFQLPCRSRAQIQRVWIEETPVVLVSREELRKFTVWLVNYCLLPPNSSIASQVPLANRMALLQGVPQFLAQGRERGASPIDIPQEDTVEAASLGQTRGLFIHAPDCSEGLGQRQPVLGVQEHVLAEEEAPAREAGAGETG